MVFIIEMARLACKKKNWAYAAHILPVSCPYPTFRAAVRFSYGFTGSAASTILLRGMLYKFEWKSWARRHDVGGIALSPQGRRAEATRWSCSKRTSRRLHGHRAFSSEPLHESCTGSVRFPCGGCGDCTATALKLHDFPGLPPRANSRNGTISIRRYPAL